MKNENSNKYTTEREDQIALAGCIVTTEALLENNYIKIVILINS